MTLGDASMRPATAADVEALAQLHRAAVVAGYAHIFPRDSEAPDITELAIGWRALLADEGAFVIVAEVDQVIAGSIALVKDDSVPAGVLLKRLHVHPNMWGGGIGSALHDAAIHAADDRGHATINLWVLEQNVRAREIYERRGWDQVTPLQTLANELPEIFDVLYERVLEPAAFESVSTWKQPMPTAASPARAALVDELASEICALSPRRLRVAVDGYTASGKTSFGHELAAAIRRLGRPTLRASLDDFKKPWRDSIEHGYDRTTGEGYYRNAPDFESASSLLLQPAGPDGSGQVVLCAHDPLTGVDHRDVTVTAPADGVLIVDSVFAFRPEYDNHWDFRIWLDIPPELSLQRGIARDSDREGKAEAERLHRDRYHASEQIYIADVDPLSQADIVIDNTDFAEPNLSERNHRWKIALKQYERHESRRGRRHAFEALDPERTALIVIDMIPFFVDDSAYARGITRRINRVARVLRAAGGTAAWVTPKADPNPGLANEFYGPEVANRYRTSGADGSVSALLTPHDQDLFCTKTAASAFFPGRCDLPARLAERDIDTVLITGTVANVCCESSARDAHTLGYRVVMVADGVAAPTNDMLNATLRTIYRSFGDVRPATEVISLLSG